MQGVYDYRGECFGYIIGDKLYDLDDRHSGYISEKAVTALDGTFVWHIDRDGLYDKHWQSIGYIGSSPQNRDFYDD